MADTAPRALTAAEVAERINAAIAIAGVELQTALIAMATLIGTSIGLVALSADHAGLLAAIIHDHILRQAAVSLNDRVSRAVPPCRDTIGKTVGNA